MERAYNKGMKVETCKHRFKFVKRLSDILLNDMLNHIVAWSIDGTLVEIKDPGAFSEIVLPQYYRHNNLTNFIRQLNMYNFKKIKRLDNNELSISYKNPLFTRDQPHLIPQIQRKKKDKSSDCNSNLITSHIQMTEYENRGNGGIQQNMFDSYYDSLKNEINELNNKINTLTKINRDLLRKKQTTSAAQSNTSSYIESLEYMIGLLYKKLVCQEEIELPNLDFMQSLDEHIKLAPQKILNNVVTGKDAILKEWLCDKKSPSILNHKRRRECKDDASNGNGLDSDIDYLSSKKAKIVENVFNEIKIRKVSPNNMASNYSYDRLKASLCLDYAKPSDFQRQLSEEQIFEKQFPQDSFCYNREDTLSKTVSLNELYFD